MTRKSLNYSERSTVRLTGGPSVAVSEPEAGFFRFRLGASTVKGAVRIWHGPPHDPVTGEELDRSHRWQATFNGEPVDFDRVWPACATDPLSEEEYRYMLARQDWARKHAPDSAWVGGGRRYDPLDTRNPLPF